MAAIHHIPNVILAEIFGYFSTNQLVDLRLVSKRNKLIADRVMKTRAYKELGCQYREKVGEEDPNTGWKFYRSIFYSIKSLCITTVEERRRVKLKVARKYIAYLEKREVKEHVIKIIDCDKTLSNLSKMKFKDLQKNFVSFEYYYPIHRNFRLLLSAIYKNVLSGNSKCTRGVVRGILAAWNTKDLATLGLFSKIKANLNICVENKSTMLLSAMNKCHYKLAEFLINLEGINLNAKDEGGAAAIHFAACNGWSSGLSLLLKKGVKIDQRGPNQCTALFFAVIYNKYNVAKFLLNNGANPNLKEINGNVPLAYAIQGKHRKIRDLLVEFGAKSELMHNWKKIREVKIRYHR